MKKILFVLTAAIIAISASAQTKRALVIGISDYPQKGADPWGPIHGANDAELIVPILQGQGFETTKICNKTATAEKIRKALNTLVKTCRTGDIVYLHFSCHGQPFEDLNGDEGEKDGWDESIVPYDAQKVFKKGKYKGESHIIDDELYAYFQKIRKRIGRSGFVCVVVDACHAGGSSRGEDDTEDGDDDVFVRGTDTGFSLSGKDFVPIQNKTSFFRIQEESGLAHIAILEACRSYESNYEIKDNDKYYGPLSYYICKVLKDEKFLCRTDWILKVRKLMNSDNRLTTQHMVYETTLK